MNIFALTGLHSSKKVGKSTVAEIMQEKKEFNEYAFGDELKNAVFYGVEKLVDELKYTGRINTLYRKGIDIIKLQRDFFDDQNLKELDLNISTKHVFKIFENAMRYSVLANEIYRHCSLIEMHMALEELRTHFHDHDKWSIRKLLQTFGTDLICNKCNKYVWVTLVVNDFLYSGDENIIVSDCRQPHEEEILRRLGSTFIFIDRTVDYIDSHYSERGLSPQDGDIILDNNSTLENLRKQVFDNERI